MIWNRPPAFFLFSYSIIQFILYKPLCLVPLSLPPFVFSRSEMTWYLHDIYLTISYSQLLFPFFLFFISQSPVPDSFSSEVKRAFEGEKDDWESERERVRQSKTVVGGVFFVTLQASKCSQVHSAPWERWRTHLWLQACGAHSVHMETKWESEESIITYYQ